MNTALREINARRRRLAALERMAERYERGEFDPAVTAWEHRKATDSSSSPTLLDEP